MIRIFQLSTLRCRIAPLGMSDAPDIAERLDIPAEEIGAMLFGAGERRLLGIYDCEAGRLHALLLIARTASSVLALGLHVAAGARSTALAAEALAEVMRALAAAHPFDRLEAHCLGEDPALDRLLAAQGFERHGSATPFALRHTSPAAARIDVC
ncbi:hypothetical protein [Flavisphingomonas formosensis]|uniref:hypothetical protein n=1 Tax=Flavisphingomonas formosensis TaxID=861534 RepID=UPI0018DFBADD|nr:hypothetical protein [Sphingomonas formosensis]